MVPQPGSFHAACFQHERIVAPITTTSKPSLPLVRCFLSGLGQARVGTEGWQLAVCIAEVEGPVVPCSDPTSDILHLGQEDEEGVIETSRRISSLPNLNQGHVQVDGDAINMVAP